MAPPRGGRCLPPPMSNTGSVLRVYLDQNKWVDLGRAKNGDPRGASYVGVYEEARAAVLDGRASFPLSVVHLAESWKARDSYRHELGMVMMELSRRDTIAPMSSLIPPETEMALHRRFRKPIAPQAPQPFGVGMPFAITGDITLSDPAEPFDPDAALREHMTFLADSGAPELASHIAERRLLSGKFRDSEERLRTALSAPDIRGLDPRRPFVHLAGQALGRTWTDISLVHDIPVSAYKALGQAGLTDLFADIPSVWALTTLRLRKHGDLKHPWKDNDLNDLKGLSVAGIYCDVVVGEKGWIHHMRQAGFEERYGTTLLTDLNDLRPLLVAPK